MVQRASEQPYELVAFGPAPLIELFEHIGVEARPAIFARLMPMIEAHSTQRVLSDADTYLRFLTTRPEVGAGPVAVAGYCIGGPLAMRTAAVRPRLHDVRHRRLRPDRVATPLGQLLPLLGRTLAVG